jgi:hypothetical protein
MSFRPEKEQIEFEFAGAAVAMASTCSCVRGSVPGGPLTSPAKAAPAVRLKEAAAQRAAANFLWRIDVPPHLAAIVAAVEDPAKILRTPRAEVKRAGVDLSQRALALPRGARTLGADRFGAAGTANSACAASGLNDFDSESGQNASHGSRAAAVARAFLN